MEDLKERIAKAALNRDVFQLTLIAQELEEAKDCDKRTLRAEVLRLLAMLIGEVELAKKYLDDALKALEGCDQEEAKKVLAQVYATYILIDPSKADEVIERIEPKDATTAAVYALALAIKRDPKAFEIIKKYYGTPSAATYSLMMALYYPVNQRPTEALVNTIRESFRFYTYKSFPRVFRALAEEALSRKLVGDDKAKVYSVIGIIEGDDALAMQAFKAAKDEFIKDFSRVAVAETLISKNPEMAVKYAEKVKPRDDPRGTYVTAMAKFIASKKTPNALYDAYKYALKAYLYGLEQKGLSYELVEYVLASVARAIAYLAYKLQNSSLAELLAPVCKIIDTFKEYKPIIAKVCACRNKILGRDYSEYKKLYEGYSDSVLDECLS